MWGTILWVSPWDFPWEKNNFTRSNLVYLHSPQKNGQMVYRKWIKSQKKYCNVNLDFFTDYIHLNFLFTCGSSPDKLRLTENNAYTKFEKYIVMMGINYRIIPARIICCNREKVCYPRCVGCSATQRMCNCIDSTWMDEGRGRGEASCPTQIDHSLPRKFNCDLQPLLLITQKHKGKRWT